MTEIRIQKNPYMPGLDGLRALAVFAVIGFHLGLPFVPGGFLGVTLFFVLSGYLITDILMSEWTRDAKVSLKNFYIRRTKRLLPGVLFLLVSVTAYVAVCRPELLTNLKSAILPALFFFSNWWYIWSGTPYFGSFATPSLLNHFWSLAVEAQFYLIWPVFLAALLRFVKKKWLIVVITAGLAVLSAGWMALLYQPGTDPSRVYYGTDTRIFSLLLGAFLALLCPSYKITKTIQEKRTRISFEVAGVVALLGVLFAAVYLTQYDDFLYRGGMFLFSSASLLLIAAAANPSTKVGRFFSIKPLRFIGNISYGMYLWQFPVIVISNAVMQSNKVNVLLSIGQVAATILLATFSYYFIEKPIRRRKILESLRNGLGMNFLRMRWWKKTAVLLAATLVLVAGIGLVYAKPVTNTVEDELSALPSELHVDPTDDAAVSAPGQLPDSSTDPASGGIGSTEAAPPTDPPSAVTSSTSSYENEPEIASHLPDSDTEGGADSGQDSLSSDIIPSDINVTLIGDSIGIDVEPYLKKYYPNLNVEAKVGRQFYEAKNILQDLINNNKLAPTVIIELGSNGTVKESSLRDIIELIGTDRKIIFVNTQIPRSWCADVNSTLSKVCADYANTTVADWYSASIDKSDYFYKDAVHPNKAGSQVMAKVIADAVTELQAV